MQMRFISRCACALIVLLVLWLSTESRGQGFGVALEQDWLASLAWQGNNEIAAEKELKKFASLRIEGLQQLCDLDEGQIEQLNFAFRADLERYRRKVGVIRDELDKLNLEDGTAWQEASTIVNPVRELYERRLFDEGCLLKKAIDSALKPNQLMTYHQHLKNRKKRQTDIIVNAHIRTIEKYIPLMANQRSVLKSELGRLCEQLPCLRNRYRHFVLPCICGIISEDQLVEVFQFDKGQVAAWKQVHAQYEGYEEWLKTEWQFDLSDAVKGWSDDPKVLDEPEASLENDDE